MAPKVEGVPEVVHALDDIAAHDFTAVNRTIAARILPGARSLAPVRTGALAGSLEGVGTKAGASITSPLDYSVPMEFGAPRRSILGIHYAERAMDAGMAQTEADYLAEVERATRKADLGWG